MLRHMTSGRADHDELHATAAFSICYTCIKKITKRTKPKEMTLMQNSTNRDYIARGTKSDYIARGYIVRG